MPLKAQPSVETKAPVEAPVEALVELTDTELKILQALTSRPSGRKDLLGHLGYSQPTGNYKSAMENFLQQNLIERTLPDKPASRLQKYRITEKGERLL